MATHSSVLAWRIPGTGEPDGLPSMGSHRVRYDWSDLAAAAVAQLVKNLPTMQETLVRFLGWEFPWRRNRLPSPVFLGFPCGSDCKESAHNAGELGSIPGLGRSPGGLRSMCCMLSCSVVSDSATPTDCSPPGSSVHGDSPGKNTGVGCHALLLGIFPTQGSNPGLPHCRQILYHLRLVSYH